MAVRRWPIRIGIGSRTRGDPKPPDAESARAPSKSWIRKEDVTRLIGRVRGRHLAVVDALGLAIGAYAALVFRFERILSPGEFGQQLAVVGVLIAMVVAMGVRLDLYSRDWRFASVADLFRIVIAVSLGVLVTIVVVYTLALIQVIDWAYHVPRGFWPTELLIGVALVGGVRFGIRAASEWASHPGRAIHVQRRATLLYGAGRTGVLIARSAQRQPSLGVVPVGFLDDDRGLHGSIVSGLRVMGGLESLKRIVETTGAQQLLITMPGATGPAIRRVFEAGVELDLEVRTVPSMSDVFDGRVDAHRARQVRVEDLLRRPIALHHSAPVAAIIEDKVVLITGAGGSIGSELARQVLAIRPRRLILVDRAESDLYLVQRELEARRGARRKTEIVAKLANVASRPAMERLFTAEAPNVVFHAAAYKHVPMLEEHPSEGVHVNVGGTLAVLDYATAAGVDRFVLVSTDKAVKPTSVMGATKRIAEMLVADAARRTGRPYVSVRFGNVLGSTGSVVPVFQDQLAKNLPLTITHPEMTRYFMTIPEASWLILDAAALGKNGDMFVLDMGEPVRIIDLAKDLTRLAGRDPDTQPIEIVGLRPGEKLHEELFYEGEVVEPTSSDKVLRAAATIPAMNIRAAAVRLQALADGEHEVQLRAALFDLAAGDAVRPTDEALELGVGAPVMAPSDWPGSGELELPDSAVIRVN